MSHTYTTQDGKTAVPVNPYKLLDYNDRYTYTHHKQDDVSRNNRMYKDFERNNPPIPLTTERPDLIGKEFEGEVVWQYQERGEKEWEIANPAKGVKFEDWANHLYDIHDTATRQAVQALSVPVKGEEKPLYILDRALNSGNINDVVKTVSEMKFDGEEAMTDGEKFYTEEKAILDDIDNKIVWNSAIDACIEAANSLPYKPFLLIDKLNSLRK